MKHLSIPNIPKIKIQKDIDSFDIKEFKKTNAYKKHILPFRESEKKRKRIKHISWLKENAFNIINLFFTVITLLATIILGILQLKN